ncbi:rhodanese-related sulfurtransferase [Oceanihabitans sediminis]|uniref:Rhodanese-like domain-containing protein n=1 Tax=Oceanihabitans sediminis TaxID=1812012 RepID=A0A368P8G5_9FLAO|nr:rhodanese-like domain-containing protein [Oceanihabitans sediminis]RBP32960.1 rhodanese-related sulfurtransferase [Oceanihabitans sediminis]RCU57521.1 rhodanese-like domain-containing protein [Oceanihabitans sediminis]
MKKSLIFSVFTILFIACNAQNDVTKVLSKEAFKSQIENNEVQLIDVRTPEEFAEGHIEGAVNIDYYSEDLTEKLNKLNKEAPVYLYCRSGNRSNKTSKQLEEMGFTEIYDLEGGILNYNK